jgi:hypothetical protein
MGAGKALAVIGGLLVIVATFLLTLYASGGQFASGINLVMNIMTLFSATDIWGWVFVVVFIIFLLSGILILIGVKSRALAIIGALVPLVLSIFIILGPLGILSDMYSYFGPMLGDQLVPDIIPFDLQLWPSDVALGTVSLGTYILLVGGLFGLISGFMSRD